MLVVRRIGRLQGGVAVSCVLVVRDRLSLPRCRCGGSGMVWVGGG